MQSGSSCLPFGFFRDFVLSMFAGFGQGPSKHGLFGLSFDGRDSSSGHLRLRFHANAGGHGYFEEMNAAAKYNDADDEHHSDFGDVMVEHEYDAHVKHEQTQAHQEPTQNFSNPESHNGNPRGFCEPPLNFFSLAKSRPGEPAIDTPLFAARFLPKLILKNQHGFLGRHMTLRPVVKKPEHD